MVNPLLVKGEDITFFKYAVFGVSYLINSLSQDELKKLKAVILFGSVAQGNATADSDVDIFFDMDIPKTVQKEFKTKLNKAAEQFYLSNLAFKFKLKGIDNSLSIIVGKLEEWPDLKRSIASTGIALYQKYVSKIEEKSKTLFSIENIKKNKGALLNKLYGYKAKKKRYPGLIQKCSGSRLGSAFIVSSEKKQLIVDAFKKYNVDYTMQDVWV